MISRTHPLRRIFHDLVRECFRDVLPKGSEEISSYVADMLTEFSSTDKLYPLTDAEGHPVRDIEALLLAADPVHGTAASFDAERRMRKHIGDYLLFSAWLSGSGRRVTGWFHSSICSSTSAKRLCSRA
jgi:hypothetical protein